MDLLERYFSPSKMESEYCLAVVSGTDGSRLTHSHERQFHFVLQSLTLWRDIANDMFKLWIHCENDLLDPTNEYTQVRVVVGGGWWGRCVVVSRD